MKYLHERPTYTITRSYFGRSMTDYVLGQIIGLERNLFEFCKAQSQKKWIDGEYYGDDNEYRLISELTVGILGIGAIGMFCTCFAVFEVQRIDELDFSGQNLANTWC